ncbi:MAG: hypothetical protein RL616_1760, partial [Verrucomicrobiota bacterium]
MNPDKPSRDEIEVKLTALLLGELPAAEAKLLRYTISQDASLQKLHDELESTIVLVREVAKNPAEASGEKTVPLKLSDARRGKLLAHFKTPRPQESFWIKRLELPRLVTALAVIALVAVVAAMLMPSLAAAKKKARHISMLSGETTMSMESSAKKPTPASAAPATVTLAPEPVLAPPPVQIVLPPTESPAQVAAITGSPADSFAFQTAAGSEPVAFGGSQAGDALKSVNGATGTRSSGAVVGVVNGFADAGGFRNSGQGGGGGGRAGGKPATDSSALAWYGDNMNRSKAEGGTSNLGEEYRRNAPAGNATANFELGASGAFALTPAHKLPDIASSKVVGEGAVDRKLKLENSDQLLTSGLRQSQMRATPVTTVINDFGFQQGVPASNDGDIAANKFYRAPAREGVDNNGSFDAAVPSAAPVKPGSSPNTVLFAAGEFSKRTEELKLADKSGSSTLSLGATKDSVQQQLAKDDVAVNNAPDSFSPAPTLDRDQLRKIKTEMARSDISKEALDSLKQTLADAQKKDFENAIKLQPYYDEKVKLAQMEEVHQMLGLKMKALETDLGVPTTAMVQITETAKPNQQQSLWQGLKGEYASAATIKVEPDGGIIQGFGQRAATDSTYDPYFVQTMMEVIKSQLVLGKVVDELKLDTAWANENGGQKLSKSQAMERLKSQLDLKPIKNTKQLEISVTSSKPEEAAKLANAVAKAYKNYRVETVRQLTGTGLKVLQNQYTEDEKRIREMRAKVESIAPKATVEETDKPLPKLQLNAPIPQPEILTRENNFSTFSLNVSDVSFKLAAASLERGKMPDAASIRSEEFINAFDYRDPEAAAGQPLAFASERARYPFAQNRELLRFSVKTAAAGRPAGRALNLVLLLDNSGSMERADRVAIIREALRVLATQLQPQDTVSVVTFARTARLWADGLPGDKAGETLAQVGGITPEGGTNLEEAMRLAYETVRRHYLANGLNRVVLLTDGAANLGDVNPGALKQKVEAQRKQGIALDCFGIGQQDYNDELLEQLSSNGDGRYAFLNSPEDASKEFAAKLAGALQIAASDVKVQVEFNPQRVISYRQIGYAKHQLTKEQFRDNTVDAAEIAAQEAGNALYTVETKADGIGPIATVRVRYKVPGTTDYRERSWDVAYTGNAPALEQSSAAMRLASTASAFSEWLASSPFAQEI